MLRRLYAFSLTILISFFVGCFDGDFDPTEAADLTDPKEYNSNQIFFKYPKNWKISGDSFTPAIHNLFVETTGDALVIFQSYQSELAEDLETFSKSFSESHSNGNSSGGDFAIRIKNDSQEGDFEGIQETFDISILGISVPHKRIFLSKKIAERQVFLIYQAAIEDNPQTELGFNLIRDTLKEYEGN